MTEAGNPVGGQIEVEVESTRYYRLDAAAQLCGLSATRARRYVRAGLIRPARVEGREVLLGEAEMAQLRRIRRLADDLGLNLAGVEVTLRLLDEIARLQETVARLERRQR